MLDRALSLDVKAVCSLTRVLTSLTLILTLTQVLTSLTLTLVGQLVGVTVLQCDSIPVSITV